MLYTIHICMLLLAIVPMQLYGCSSVQPARTVLAEYPSEYPGLAQGIADLPIQCLQNSILARTVRVKVFTNEHASRRATVIAEENPELDSTVLQVPPFTIGQLLNAMPREFSNDASGYDFWYYFAWHCGIPLTLFGAGALFSTYVKNIDLEKLAYVTAAMGSIGILNGLWTMSWNSDHVYQKEINRREGQHATPCAWLRTRVDDAGIYDYLVQQGVDLTANANQDAKRYYASHYLIAEYSALFDALNQNEANLAAAGFKSPRTEAREFYASVHRNVGLASLFGGVATSSVAALSAVYLSKQ